MIWRQTVLITLCCLSFAAKADLQVAQQFMVNPASVGEARFSKLFFKVYDATLYAPGGHWQADQPFALSLRYLRDFKHDDVVGRTLSEIRGQGYTNEARLADWKRQLLAIFPDISAGNEITGVRDSKGQTVFFLGSKRIGVVADIEFTQHFFDIWLSSKTSEPALRRQLLKLDQ